MMQWFTSTDYASKYSGNADAFTYAIDFNEREIPCTSNYDKTIVIRLQDISSLNFAVLTKHQESLLWVFYR